MSNAEKAKYFDVIDLLYNGSKSEAEADISAYYQKCCDQIRKKEPTFMLSAPLKEDLLAFYFEKGIKIGEIHYKVGEKCQVYVNNELISKGDNNLTLEDAINLIQGN
jgi:hypothetical protein